MSVIHGDIKPGNLLIMDEGRLVCFADFGHAMMGGCHDSSERHKAYTATYRPPEVDLPLS
jgi:serine/threonine protein kinase